MVAGACRIRTADDLRPKPERPVEVSHVTRVSSTTSCSTATIRSSSVFMASITRGAVKDIWFTCLVDLVGVCVSREFDSRVQVHVLLSVRTGRPHCTRWGRNSLVLIKEWLVDRQLWCN